MNRTPETPESLHTLTDDDLLDVYASGMGTGLASGLINVLSVPGEDATQFAARLVAATVDDPAFRAHTLDTIVSHLEDGCQCDEPHDHPREPFRISTTGWADPQDDGPQDDDAQDGYAQDGYALAGLVASGDLLGLYASAYASGAATAMVQAGGDARESVAAAARLAQDALGTTERRATVLRSFRAILDGREPETDDGTPWQCMDLSDVLDDDASGDGQ